MPLMVLVEGHGNTGKEEPNLDIIAIHGLNPMGVDQAEHAIRTWTCEPHRGSAFPEGHMWIRDSLPSKLPRARIMLYEYNSSPVFGDQKSQFQHEANSALDLLRIHRRDAPDRPLIMIGHSLGGILIKQMLCATNPTHQNIIKATYGLVFFGTPHRGSELSPKIALGKLCASIALSIRPKGSSAMMESLSTGTLFADILHNNFKHKLADYKVISFYGLLDVIVGRDSVDLGLAGNRENVQPLASKHQDPCRFNLESPADKKNYDLVEGLLTEMCDEAAGQGSVSLEIIKKSLKLPGCNRRYEDIEQTFQILQTTISTDKLSWTWTLSWIWETEGPQDTKPPGFIQWLESGSDDIFWFSGFPGSGKSTLMNYLSRNPGVVKHLETNKSGKWTMVKYFFAEVTGETNFDAMLQSVLLQLLESHKDLAATFRDASPAYNRFDKRPSDDAILKTWARADLEKLLYESMAILKERNICVFLDGIDECIDVHQADILRTDEFAKSQNEDLQNRARFLRNWITHARDKRCNLKLCLAGRESLDTRYGLGLPPSCIITWYTKEGIRTYVSNILEAAIADLLNHKLTATAKRIEAGKASIIQGIVDKSEGVYLWVRLVAAEIATGIREGKDPATLHKEIESLPRELEKLFTKIIECVRKRDLPTTIRYFELLVLASQINKATQAMSLEEFAIATQNPDHTLSMSFKSEGEAHEWVDLKSEETRLNILKSCRGLIELQEGKGSFLFKITSSAPCYVVSWLHVSIKHYMMSEAWDEWKVMAAEFSVLPDPNLMWMAGTLQILRICNRSWDDKGSGNQPLQSHFTKTALDDVHQLDCKCWTEYCKHATFPWDKRSGSKRKCWHTLEQFFQHAWKYEDAQRAKNAAQPEPGASVRDIICQNDPRPVTKPFFEELQMIFSCFCANFLPTYWESEKVPCSPMEGMKNGMIVSLKLEAWAEFSSTPSENSFTNLETAIKSDSKRTLVHALKIATALWLKHCPHEAHRQEENRWTNLILRLVDRTRNGGADRNALKREGKDVSNLFRSYEDARNSADTFLDIDNWESSPDGSVTHSHHYQAMAKAFANLSFLADDFTKEKDGRKVLYTLLPAEIKEEEEEASSDVSEMSLDSPEIIDLVSSSDEEGGAVLHVPEVIDLTGSDDESL
ncbi:hypothetical protein VTL71DRAFT_4936 [Oculimacula yallundae]|uniref:Nephrocystin 3-like N-terminal domain-containing protein n=1 Tax=Oculimacula yallundae TaxID=86028 RepID=A0ABR4C4J8_9HELO